MKIQTLPLTTIQPYWRNPRDNEMAVTVVMQSIKDYGFNSPLVIDRDNIIIAGHTRYKALQRLGYTEAACVVADLPADKAKAYRIADNKASEFAQWDLSKLIPELREIQEPADMELYFPEYDLSELIDGTDGKDIAPVSQKEIGKVADQKEAQFEDASSTRAARVVDVSCPSCGESFGVSRTDIER